MHPSYKGCNYSGLDAWKHQTKLLQHSGKNWCTLYLHHLKVWCISWCTTIMSQSESRDSGLTGTKGNNCPDHHLYARWCIETHGVQYQRSFVHALLWLSILFNTLLFFRQTGKHSIVKTKACKNLHLCTLKMLWMDFIKIAQGWYVLLTFNCILHNKM